MNTINRFILTFLTIFIFGGAANADVACGMLHTQLKEGIFTATIVLGENTEDQLFMKILNPFEFKLSQDQCTCVIGETSPRDRAFGDDDYHKRFWITERFTDEEKYGCQ